MPRLAGPFERNGVKPRSLDVSRVARTEGAREVVAYLAARNAGHVLLDWDRLTRAQHEDWIKAVTEVFAKANREAAKAAVAELAEWEELALLVSCRRCGADEEEPCRDLRRNFITHIKHPHAERMQDMEES
jgi:hypothetical protein